MNVRLQLLALGCILSALPCSSRADNWAHWRGPTGNGVSPSATPPTEWSETKNVRWKTAIPGKGSGSPIVWENRVFVVTAVPTATSQSGERARVTSGRLPPGAGPSSPGGRGGRQGRSRRGGRGGPPPNLDFKVLCLDRATGEVVWERTAVNATPHEGTHSTNGYASASPCTDGTHIYAHFGSRGLYCYSFDGELQWKRTDFGQMQARAGFGEGSSPTIVDDKLIVPWDHEGASALYALNKNTGKTIWKVSRDEPTCWATPLVIEHAGRKQIVMNGQNYARGYDLESGDELWRCGGQTDRPAASAVGADGMVFVGSGYRGSYLGAFRLGGSGDIANTSNVAWSTSRDTPDIASPLLSEDRLYFYKARNGILSCFSARTGKPYFDASRIQGLGDIYASPVAANGYVYLSDRQGNTVVIKDAEKLEIVATNAIGETIDATPAPADDELFIRGATHLFCIGQ